MRVGDYVRLNCTVYDTVVINRIAEIFDNTILTENDGSMYQGEYSKEEIIKSSPNIIDILEVGDYVNGSKLLSIEYAEDRQGNCDKAHFYYSFEDNDKDINEYYEELIVKSIVTKEQFECMEYKVESEVN